MEYQEFRSSTPPEAGVILNSIAGGHGAPDRSVQFPQAPQSIGAAAEDAAHPLIGIIRIAVPISAACWAAIILLARFLFFK